ncbi:MAG TPA: hypothetical protein PKV21_06185 [bacterium]|nr:hypothetical protein [bacterium]
MKTSGKIERVKIKYKQKVPIPPEYKSFFWDCQNEVILEKFILRVLNYGNIEDIEEIYKKYPEETYDIAFRYPEIKRGIKFWLKLWKEEKLKK